MPEVAACAAGQAQQAGAALLWQLGRREYFQHVWRHLGDGILRPLQPGPRPWGAYARALPDDIRQARCGAAAIDRAVRQLYARGWLHHAARLWLASYVVPVRGVHWRSGADWLQGHLLDGDLTSNHLSWQCVAGIGSLKPWLFNAARVANFAAGQPGCASPSRRAGTARRPTRCAPRSRNSGAWCSAARPPVDSALAIDNPAARSGRHGR